MRLKNIWKNFQVREEMAEEILLAKQNASKIEEEAAMNTRNEQRTDLRKTHHVGSAFQVSSRFWSVWHNCGWSSRGPR